jgi:hypothetical protein
MFYSILNVTNSVNKGTGTLNERAKPDQLVVQIRGDQAKEERGTQGPKALKYKSR